MSTPLQRALAAGPNALIDEFKAAAIDWNNSPGENDIRERYRVAHAALYEALVRPPSGCGIARAWLAEWSDRDDASRMEVLFDEPAGDHGYERVTALGVIPPGDVPSNAQRVLADAARFIAAVPPANEWPSRRTGESRLAHQDRVSSAIQENEDRRELLNDIAAAIAALPAAN